MKSQRSYLETDRCWSIEAEIAQLLAQSRDNPDYARIAQLSRRLRHAHVRAFISSHARGVRRAWRRCVCAMLNSRRSGRSVCSTHCNGESR